MFSKIEFRIKWSNAINTLNIVLHIKTICKTTLTTFVDVFVVLIIL
jgi:hypothetical protein